MAGTLLWSYAPAAIVLYLVSLVFYRLTFSPLAKFPGPVWTAITRYYEGYFDVIKGGQYTFKIAEMHKKYGPIIRISPYELHVSDPEFFDLLYRQESSLDKYDWAVDAFAAKGATIFTVSHDVHKARRQPLNPFFSKARVAGQQDLIHRHLNKFNHRLAEFARTGANFNVGAAMTAVVRDIANDYILGKSYDSLGREDFDIAMLAASQGSGSVWRLTKFIRFVAPTMQKMPISWIMKFGDEEVKTFFRFLQESQEDTKKLMATATSPTVKDTEPRTVVHEIMASKLPPSEKEFERVFQDVSTVSGAGFETTASVLRLILFHVFSEVTILQRLRSELASTGATHDRPLDLKLLEQLPFLTAIITEAMRLSPAIATRMARVVPDTGLSYQQWRIPAGTAVGMTLILMHTDENIYPAPKAFNPDRWMENGMFKKPEQAYAPFSRGARNCLGMQLAWAELYIIVADFVQRFNLHLESSSAADFECVEDSFAVGTPGKGTIIATITPQHAD